MGSSEIPAEESNVRPPPSSLTPAPMASCAELVEEIPLRRTPAFLSAERRSRAPSPDRRSESAPDKVPLEARDDPCSSVTRSFATRTRSCAARVDPLLSTVTLPAETVTCVPAAVTLRRPPMSRLSAPNESRVSESRKTVPGNGLRVPDVITVASGVLISMLAPRPLATEEEATFPRISMAWDAWKTSKPESSGSRETDPPSRLKNVFPRNFSYSARSRTILEVATSKRVLRVDGVSDGFRELKRKPETKLEESGISTVAEPLPAAGVTSTAPGSKA